jgi:hypothetical protein
MRLVSGGCLPDADKNFLGQVSGLGAIADEAKNQIQYAALVPLYQKFKGMLVPLGGRCHQCFVGNEWVNHFAGMAKGGNAARSFSRKGI